METSSVTAPDFIPDGQFKPDPSAQVQAPAHAAPDFVPDSKFQSDEERFGTPGQQALTAVEGGAKGLLGPLATAGEAVLTKYGVPGLSPEEQAGRAETNPVIHGGSEAATFLGSALAGTGEAALLGEIGSGAAKLAGVGAEGASAISKIAASGIKTGAEMAALQAGDEVSKAINQDPGQTLGTAAINVGLSGVIGGAGGTVLGAVSPLWSASVERMGIPKLIDDAKAQYNFRQELPNGGDVPAAITDELNTRLSEVDSMRSQVSQLKGNAIAAAIPEMSEKISGQVNQTIDTLQSQIEKMRKDPSSYPARLVNKIEQNLETFKNRVFGSGDIPQPIETPENPDYFEGIPKTVLRAPKPLPERIEQISSASKAAQSADISNIEAANRAGFNPYDLSPKPKLSSPLDIFNALQDLKSDLQDYSKGNYGAFAIPSHNEAYDFVHASKSLARDVRLGLEDSSIWGSAGDIQRKTNAAIKASIDAEKDAASKFTAKSALEGGRVVDPTKINTLVNQSLKGKEGLKGDFIGNYIKHTDELADTINRIHTDAGLEAPIRLTPTPTLNHTLGRSSPGTTLGNWLFDKGLANIAGHSAGIGIGEGLGALVGHPFIGAIAGERLLAPALTSIAKPLLESATRSEGMKGALDYVVNVLRGTKALNQAAESFFRAGSEIIPNQLMPNSAAREKLEKSLEYADNPDHMMNVGGHLGHYMPDHATAAAATAAGAANYFKQLKPKQIQNSPLDKPSPIDKFQKARYDRQLDIAQQPLLVLKHARNGTLQPQDIQTINAVYPGLMKKISSQIFSEMSKTISEGKSIPTRQRASLSLLLGLPLDSTMIPAAMQAVIMANAPKGSPPQPQGKPKKVSKSTASTMERANKLYATPEQARAAEKVSG